MKQKTIFFIAVLLALLMTACGGAAPAPAVETVPETTAVSPTLPLPEVTQPPAPETEPPVPETEPFVPEIRPVITQEQSQVRVHTPDEFLAAIAPNTEIIVDAPLLDWSTATGYGTGSGDYYYWSEAFDGPELTITDISNLTIRGAGEERSANVLSAVPRYANVLTFENCSSIYITGLTAGHTREPGSCMGGVLCFQNSQDILVENCGLFGCGTLGVKGYSSRDLQVVNNEIYECSVGGVEFTNCDDVNVDGNTFRDLGGPVFRVYDCGSITCNGEPVFDHIPRQ